MDPIDKGTQNPQMANRTLSLLLDAAGSKKKKEGSRFSIKSIFEKDTVTIKYTIKMTEMDLASLTWLPSPCSS